MMSGLTAIGSRWLLFYAFIFMAWAALFAMVLTSQEYEFTQIYGAEFWAAICNIDAMGAGFGQTLFMWLLMSAAMMAPTLVPALRVFDDLIHTKAAGNVAFGQVITGYFLVWTGFSAVAAWLQIFLAGQGMLAGHASISGPLNAVLLLLAGGYQFTAFKENCLSRCQQPLTFFIAHWDSGPLKMGLRLGAVCVGCCWALMLLGFVGGTMNLLWMGAATLLMMLEKLPEIGGYLTKPIGMIMIISGAAVAFI